MKLEAVHFAAPHITPVPHASQTIRILQTQAPGYGYVASMRLADGIVWVVAADGRERAYPIGPGDMITLAQPEKDAATPAPAVSSIAAGNRQQRRAAR